MSRISRLALLGAAAAFALPGTASAACHPDSSACVNNDVVSVSVIVRDNGSVEVWRGGYALTDQYVFCAPQFLAYLRAPERDYEAYAACAFGPGRVL
jgi:hypothetical protein